MAFKYKEKEFNGKTLKIALVGAIDGISITTQLAKVLFPVIGVIQSQEKNVANIVSAALEHADELNLDVIIKKLFSGATVDEFPLNPDQYFAGNYGELVDFLAFALEVNFGSFFEAAILKDQSLTSGR